MAIDLFTQIDAQLSDPISDFVTDGVSQLASAATGPLKVAATIYVVLHGYAIMRGLIKEPVMDFAFRALKVVILVALVTQVGTYNEYVKNVFFDALPREIGNALGRRVEFAPTAAAFDQLLKKAAGRIRDLEKVRCRQIRGRPLLPASSFCVGRRDRHRVRDLALRQGRASHRARPRASVHCALSVQSDAPLHRELAWASREFHQSCKSSSSRLSLIMKCATKRPRPMVNLAILTLAGLTFSLIFVLAGVRQHAASGHRVRDCRRWRRSGTGPCPSRYAGGRRSLIEACGARRAEHRRENGGRDGPSPRGPLGSGRPSGCDARPADGRNDNTGETKSPTCAQTAVNPR